MKKDKGKPLTNRNRHKDAGGQKKINYGKKQLKKMVEEIMLHQIMLKQMFWKTLQNHLQII